MTPLLECQRELISELERIVGGKVTVGDPVVVPAWVGIPYHAFMKVWFEMYKLGLSQKLYPTWVTRLYIWLVFRFGKKVQTPAQN